MNRSWLLLGGALPIAAVMGCSLSSSDSFASGSALPPSDAGASLGGPGAAPTGQRWEAIETDNGCGRKGITYVLVDEVCGGQGDGYDTPDLHAPMFRDGALVGNSLLAVDGTFLWSLDLGKPGGIGRGALLGGIGEPVAAAANGVQEIVLAAGAEGLVRIDAKTPLAPSVAGRIALPGFAHDVFIEGEKAYVALGKQGLGVVDLASGTLSARIDVPGYATGVTKKGDHAYVAACKSLAVVDLNTNAVVAQTWPDSAMKGTILAGPAKDVDVVGDVAFVAAGKLGTVAVDIATPAQPKVLGNCTVPAPEFYASGVRAEAGKLFVAGGEWGVLPVDVSDPVGACQTMSAKAPDATSSAPSCSAEAPWEILPWEQLWAPPPPRKDPIQVLPAGTRLFAFGDARRIGSRAVDVRNPLDASLAMLDRYDEPRHLIGLAASGGRIAALGPRGGLFTVDDAGALTRVVSDAEPIFQSATAIGFTSDGRWVAASNGKISTEGRSAPLTVFSGDVHAIAPAGNGKVVVAQPQGIELLDVVGDQHGLIALPSSHLPLSIATDEQHIYAGAPEWTKSEGVAITGGTSSSLDPHGVFDDADVEDTTLWQIRLPRRQLVATPAGLAEVAGLGPKAGLALHTTAGTREVALPPATYSGAVSDGSRVYAIGIDRNLYRSTLVTISIAGPTPVVLGTSVFTGNASGIAIAKNRLYVSNAEGELRVYTLADEPSLTSVITVEETP